MSNRSEQVNILVVDDENFFAEWLAENLRDTSNRYNAAWVNSGERAIEFLERHPVDLVISDIKMEGISGIDLLTRIRTQYPSIGVILMTGYDLPELKQEAIKRGSLFYLEKPFSMERLDSAIEAALRARPPVKQLAGTEPSAGQLALIDALHFLHLSRSSMTLRIKTPTDEGKIFYQNGEVIHAHCQDTEGEEAFSQILSWGSNNHAALPAELAPKRSIFRDFDSLINTALEPPSTGSAVTAQLSLLDVLHLFHLSRSNKALLVKASGTEGVIYYQDGEIIHAHCQSSEGEEAFSQIMAWESNNYEVLTDEPMPDQSIFRDFNSLIDAALQSSPELLVETGAQRRAQGGRASKTPAKKSKVSTSPSDEVIEPSADQLPEPTPIPTGEAEASLSPSQQGATSGLLAATSEEPPAAPAASSAIAEPSPVTEDQPQTALPVLSDKEQRQLRDSLAASDHLEGGALITQSGDLLASALPEKLLTQTAVGDLLTLFQLCHRSAEQLDRGRHYQSLIQAELGNVIISEIKNGAFLVFVTNTDAPLGLALFQAGEKAGKVNETLSRSTESR